MMTLSEFIDAEAARDFVWGVSDCCLMGADWSVSQGYGDPATAWRRRYSTEEQAIAMLSDAGGIGKACRDGLESVGWQLSNEPPAEGDIGILRLPGVYDNWPGVVAIRATSGWYVRAISGVTLLIGGDRRCDMLMTYGGA